MAATLQVKTGRAASFAPGRVPRQALNLLSPQLSNIKYVAKTTGYFQAILDKNAPKNTRNRLISRHETQDRRRTDPVERGASSHAATDQRS